MSDTSTERMKGAIAWMANNPVAANLMMFFVFAAGLSGLLQVNLEVFPEFELDVVSVSVPYPGASPSEVEQGIVLAIEEEVRGIDGVKRITSNSAEGVGTVSIELLIDSDPDKTLSDVKTAVDRITSFPEDAEEPSVSLVSSAQRVVSLIIAGDHDLGQLHELAEEARRRMLLDPEITQVEIGGVPGLEVAVEVPRENLEAYGLTLDQVAAAVRAASLELPGGGVDTRSGELLVRLSDRALTQSDFEDIVVRGTADGRVVRLGDIATVVDGFEDTDQANYLNGQRAVMVTAYRVGDETPMGVADAVHQLREDMQAEYGDTIDVLVWDDDSVLLRERIDLLVRNARLGLVLVVGLLALFLKPRLAFWVSLGIPISFFGAFMLMPGLSVSINMISLFALIITLGLVVDDAIVVGENAYTKMEEGEDPLVAATEGAREMVVPVTFAVLTTVAAFFPLLLVPGFSGKIFGIIPLVVISVLMFSLIESFFILPAHLAHSKKETEEPTGIWRTLDTPRRVSSNGLAWFIENLYQPAVSKAVEYRYITVAMAFTTLLATFGLLQGQVVAFVFFPEIEGNQVTVNARLPYGAPIERTEEVRKVLEASSREALASMEEQDLLVGMYTRVGEIGGQMGPSSSFETGSHLVAVDLELVSAESRETTARQIRDAWEARTPDIPGLESLVFTATSGPGAGAAVDVLLSHRDTEVLAQASGELTASLREYNQLTNVQNGYSAGKPQLDYTLLPQAQTLGVTGNDVARQLRSFFFGSEALREQRGRNEVKVMVRLPQEQRSSEFDVEQLEIRSPTGGSVPLHYVADFERSAAPTAIKREEGRRVVNVTAELSALADSSAPVLEDLDANVLPHLIDKYPGLMAEYGGQQREQAETFASLGRNFILALGAIFTLLAIPFRSYVQPLVVMSAIPFGIVGAVFGHFLMGFNLSVISMMGIVALSGVVVNDSLVLVDATNNYRREGADAATAIIRAGMRRFRPIMLTSLTTFLGLAPMIAETSTQARFLIPMAISLGFGVLFVTFIVLLVVPALYMIVEDGLDFWAWIWEDDRKSSEQLEDDGLPAK